MRGALAIGLRAFGKATAVERRQGTTSEQAVAALSHYADDGDPGLEMAGDRSSLGAMV